MSKIKTLAPQVGMLGSKLGSSLGVGWSDSRRGSRQARGYGTQWEKLREQILKRDNYLCQCSDCKAKDRIRPASQVDHITNKAAGGTDDPSNLQAINALCHKIKTAREAKASRLGLLPMGGVV